MSLDLIGQLCSLGAALAWAFALIFFKKTEGRVHPYAMNLFKNVLGFALITATLPLYGESWSDVAAHPKEEVYILLVSGFLGIALADTFLFYSLDLIGVSLFVIVDCTYSPLVLLVSWWMISETLTLPHCIGGLMILAAVFISTRHPPPAGRTRGQILGGIALGILSIALMAVGIVMAKPVLAASNFPLLPAIAIRTAAGAACLTLMVLASPQRREMLSVFRPSRIWRFLLPGSFLAAYLSMALWVAGFKYTSAPIAAVLNQTSMIFAIILAAIFLHEKMTARKLAAVCMAASGVVLITLAPAISFWMATRAR